MTAPVLNNIPPYPAETLKDLREGGLELASQAAAFAAATTRLIEEIQSALRADSFETLFARWLAARELGDRAAAEFECIDAALGEAQERWPEAVPIFRAALGASDYSSAEDAYFRASDRLADAILALPVTNVSQAAARYRVMLIRFGDGRGGIDQPTPFFAFADELAALGA